MTLLDCFFMRVLSLSESLALGWYIAADVERARQHHGIKSALAQREFHRRKQAQQAGLPLADR